MVQEVGIDGWVMEKCILNKIMLSANRIEMIIIYL